MVGTTPLSRLLPETSADQKGFLISGCEDEDGGVTEALESELGVNEASVEAAV